MSYIFLQLWKNEMTFSTSLSVRDIIQTLYVTILLFCFTTRKNSLNWDKKGISRYFLNYAEYYISFFGVLCLLVVMKMKRSVEFNVNVKDCTILIPTIACFLITAKTKLIVTQVQSLFHPREENSWPFWLSEPLLFHH